MHIIYHMHIMCHMIYDDSYDMCHMIYDITYHMHIIIYHMMMCKKVINVLVKDRLENLGPLSESAAAWLVSRNRKVIVQ